MRRGGCGHSRKGVRGEEGVAASPRGSICRLRSCSEAPGTRGGARARQLSQHRLLHQRLSGKHSRTTIRAVISLESSAELQLTFVFSINQ